MAFIPIGEMETEEGLFQAVYSCNDNCSGLLTPIAAINGILVNSGQLVNIEIDDEFESEFESDILNIEAPSVTLNLTCEDLQGNSSSIKTSPIFASSNDSWIKALPDLQSDKIK